jgi:EmrB/QacA subfamily drug resistance transporter
MYADNMPHPPISLARRRVITAGLLLGMTLGALEATVVGTAMPTVIAALGGLAHYSWVFSAYLLTSTASVPIWGRLSDLYGRRRMYLLGVVIFLIGSVLSGAAMSMPELIAARAFQGLGAGAVIPISLAVVGELYAITERPRTQALFSGVWGVASIAGPLIGGYVTDAISWRWVFYINVPAGLLALAIIAAAYPPSRGDRPVRVDWLGASLLFAGISAVLLALSGDTGSSTEAAHYGVAAWAAGSIAVLVAFVRVERHAAQPILPLDLLTDRLISRAFAVVFLDACAMFGAIAFIPLFVQVVQGGTATEAGQVLTPLFLGWVLAAIAGARASVRFGYRRVAISGAVVMTIGFMGLQALRGDSPRSSLYLAVAIAGAGMGFQMLSLLLAIQHSVERSRLGIATSMNQFARNIGAAVGTAAMGALVSRAVRGIPLPTGVDGSVAVSALAGAGPLRDQFARGLHQVFIAGAAISAASFLGTMFLPAVDFHANEPRTTLEHEPIETPDQPFAIE